MDDWLHLYHFFIRFDVSSVWTLDTEFETGVHNLHLLVGSDTVRFPGGRYGIWSFFFGFGAVGILTDLASNIFWYLSEGTRTIFFHYRNKGFK